MRFLFLVRAANDAPDVAALAKYHEALHQAGVLLDAAGLRAGSAGWRIRYAGGTRTVVDGPLRETDEPIAGYTLIQVKSREEAMEWARRFPNPAPDGGRGEIEVLQIVDPDDVGRGEAAERPGG